MLNASFCHAPQALYHLQRGPMLGEVAGHPDERAALATVFLNASSPLAGRMLSPALYVFDAATGTFAAVEPVDIAVIGGARSGNCKHVFHKQRITGFRICPEATGRCSVLMFQSWLMLSCACAK